MYCCTIVPDYSIRSYKLQKGRDIIIHVNQNGAKLSSYLNTVPYVFIFHYPSRIDSVNPNLLFSVFDLLSLSKESVFSLFFI